MPEIARFIGGAGTGKTTVLLDTLDKVLQHVDPLQVGFVSFTRAARREASSRAGERFGVPPSQLEQDGWFRTLHSVCYRMLRLGRGEMLADSKSDREWLSEALQADVGRSVALEHLIEDDDEGTEWAQSSTEASLVLGIWATARNRLEGVEPTWGLVNLVNDKCPGLPETIAIIEQYERAKRLDNRCDFVDLLGRFAGYRFTTSGVERCPPDGDVPNVPVWFFDEQQDASALLDAVCHRLIENAHWVYVCGDPNQSIYGFSGADAKYFLGWPAAKEKVMPKSWRCPESIHHFGQDCLRMASTYRDWGIKGADHDGGWDVERFTSQFVGDHVHVGDEWLLISRTNYNVRRLAAQLDHAGIPWVPARGQGGWNRPALNTALEALVTAEQVGGMIGEGWAQAVKKIRTKADGQELLSRGTKTKWAEKRFITEQKAHWQPVDELGEWGASPLLIESIKNGSWAKYIDRGYEFREVMLAHGRDAVMNPKVRVGTIHSAKGAEADNVLWLTTTSRPVAESCENDEGFDEECRVNYVAATRARKNLLIAVEPNKRHRASLPL